VSPVTEMKLYRFFNLHFRLDSLRSWLSKWH